MRYLVTGDPGFIGFHVARRLLEARHDVLGYDNLNAYCEVSCKGRRHCILFEFPLHEPTECGLEDLERHVDAIACFSPNVEFYIAAQAGVSYALEAPRDYVNANIIDSFNILEAARASGVKHLMVASTSSAYRPKGRPDMTYYLFTKAILAGEPINVFNNSERWRDFTFIDDLVVLPTPALDARNGMTFYPGDTLSPAAPYRLVNIGASASEKLTDLISAIEAALGLAAKKVFKPLPPGDAFKTFADATLLEQLTGRKPATRIDEGINAFFAWYRGQVN